MIEKGLKIPVLDHGHVIYLDHMGSDHDICARARASYNKANVVKTPEDDQRLIHRLYRDAHTSPLEMGKIVFEIKMPIFVARQYIRHRMQNVNEVSARYTELPDQFYIPNYWRKQSEKNKQGSSDEVIDTFPASARYLITDVSGTFYTGHMALVVRDYCRKAYELYQHLLTSGVTREQARMVLPVNIYTTMHVCWDMNNLIKFIRLREDAHAQAEIQDYAKAMKQIATELFPMVMKAYARYHFKVIDSEVTS